MTDLDKKGTSPEQYETLRRSVFANCRSVSEFEKIATVGEGTYGECFSLQNRPLTLHRNRVFSERQEEWGNCGH